jgi:DNA-binding NarL/FixJ family response regulator
VNKIILVADDNPVMRDALCELFEFEDGLELCEHAVNGQDAIEKARKFRPDLIILDLSMPVMNGLDAARILRTIMPAVPIILFTIHSKEMVSKEVQETRIDAIVSKAEMVHLVRHTRTLLRVASA